MASRRHQRRRKCDGKKRHDSMQDAIREAGRLNAQHPGESFDAYGCGQCGKFHVGHRPQKVRRVIAARRAEL